MALAAMLGLSTLLPGAARADEPSLGALQAEAQELVARIDEASRAYASATGDVDALSKRMSEATLHLQEVEAALPEKREQAAKSVKSMYLLQQSCPSLLELIFVSESFEDFIGTLHYLDAIQGHNMEQIDSLSSMHDDLTQTQATIQVELDQALGRQHDSLVALEEVRAARAELEAKMREMREAAASAASAERQRAEEFARLTEQEAAKALSMLGEQAVAATAPVQTAPAPVQAAPAPVQAAPAPATAETVDPATEGVPAMPVPEPGAAAPAPTTPTTLAPVARIAPVAQTVTSADTSAWAARIDAYLEGSPLAGYGQVFAEAAAAYGVDPRVSPAISCIESGKGSVCFRSHNAWGWGDSGWSSWEEAIRAHVSGFAGLYGSTVDLAGAKMYAGDDIYMTWYNLVLEEMASI